VPDDAASRERVEKSSKLHQTQRVLLNNGQSIGFLPCEKGNSEYNPSQHNAAMHKSCMQK
jgi:hypothetical protein